MTEKWWISPKQRRVRKNVEKLYDANKALHKQLSGDLNYYTAKQVLFDATRILQKETGNKCFY